MDRVRYDAGAGIARGLCIIDRGHAAVQRVDGEGDAPAATSALTYFVASTADVDRMDDIVEQTWKLDNFLRNPVFLWGHDYSQPPIGRVESVSVDGGALRIGVRFDESADNPFAAMVARQYRDGFLSAVSVGFRPGRVTPRSALPADDPRAADTGWGMVLMDNDLLEVSAVTVPANPMATQMREATADATQSDEDWWVVDPEAEPTEEVEAQPVAETDEDDDWFDDKDESGGNESEWWTDQDS